MTSSASKFRFAVLAAVLVTGIGFAAASPITMPPVPPPPSAVSLLASSPITMPPVPPPPSKSGVTVA